jgi:hypothetical protein
MPNCHCYEYLHTRIWRLLSQSPVNFFEECDYRFDPTRQVNNELRADYVQVEPNMCIRSIDRMRLVVGEVFELII